MSGPELQVYAGHPASCLSSSLAWLGWAEPGHWEGDPESRPSHTGVSLGVASNAGSWASAAWFGQEPFAHACASDPAWSGGEHQEEASVSSLWVGTLGPEGSTWPGLAGPESASHLSIGFMFLQERQRYPG